MSQGTKPWLIFLGDYMNNFFKKISIFLIILMAVISFPFAGEQGALKVEIKEDITTSTFIKIKEAIEYGEENPDKFSTIVFELDTYGGEVRSAEKIKNEILAADIPTICYINTKAESAGVLIALSCDKIYMNTSATMGSAETIPNNEKNLSFWCGLIRDTAEQKDRDPLIFESMADKDIEIEGVVEKGKLLNLTAKEAANLKVIDGTTSNIEKTLSDENIVSYIRETYKDSFGLKFISFISNPYVNSLLLTIAMVGFVIEIFTPGFGVGGAISIMAFVLFFMGNMVVGNSNWYAVIIFILGIVLLGIEITIPGFGLTGISGIILVILGIIFSIGNLETALVTVAVAGVTCIILVMILIKAGKKLSIFKKFTLENTASSQKGYKSVEDPSVVLEEEGFTETPLMPSGYAMFNDKKMEVISERGFIDRSKKIKVSRIEGYKIYVREVN